MKRMGSMLLAGLLCCTPCFAFAAAQGASPAAGFLEARLAATDAVLYVYKDFADGLNHFTQKAWMGDGYTHIPEMDEAAEGLEGTTGIAATLDISRHLWGGYMFTNGVLPAGEQHPAADFGNVDAGMDLTGAERLVFYAKGETGRERVEFFLGGLGWQGAFAAEPFPDSTPKISLGEVRLTTEWQRFEIPLEGAELGRVGCGFGWVTNDVMNPGAKEVRFFLDDIRYEFPAPRPGPAFLQSYAAASPDTDASIINNFAYLYDNAVAAIALSRAGSHDRARQIADAMVYAYGHDRTFEDGRLRNAYNGGNPASFPGWQSGKGGAFARLPGFYSRQEGQWYEDVYAVSTSTGNLAWAMLALCEVYRHAPERAEYIETARAIGNLILELQEERGGFTGGFEGWDEASARVTYKSTEHNIDLIPAFARLAEGSGEAKYREASEAAKAFVLSMYDPERGCFYTGTTADGVTVNKDVLPLDCNTWAILALGDDFGDGEKVMAFVEEHMAVDGGYDFNDDRDGVWFEGTAQVALAYLQLGDGEKYAQVLAYLEAHANPDGSITAADRDGVTTGFSVSGMDIPWKYDRRTHVGATAWLALVQLGQNPLEEPPASP